jgi:hypothetical protein
MHEYIALPEELLKFQRTEYKTLTTLNKSAEKGLKKTIPYCGGLKHFSKLRTGKT